MTQETANLTALSSFNELIRAVDGAATGRLSPAAALAATEPFDREFQTITTAFHSELRFQLDSPTLQEELPKVLESFVRIGQYLTELKGALQAEDVDRAQRLTRRLSRRVSQMMTAFEALKAEEASRPELSPSPYINELLRVAYAYLDGQLTAQHLSERLQGVMTHLQGFLSTLEQTAPDPKEAGLLADHRGEMDEALDEQLEALHEIEEHLRLAGDPRDIELPLETLRETTQSLYELTQQLAQAILTEEQKHCFRCGAANEMSARFCSRCNAVFPTYDADAGASSQVNVRLEEEIVSAAPTQLPPLVRQLLETVEATASGRTDEATLKTELDAAQTRMRNVERMLGQLEEPDEDTPEDQLKVFYDSLQAMREGLAAFDEGLEMVAGFLKQGDKRVLWDALHKLTPAAEQLASLQNRGTAWISQASKK